MTFPTVSDHLNGTKNNSIEQENSDEIVSLPNYLSSESDGNQMNESITNASSKKTISNQSNGNKMNGLTSNGYLDKSVPKGYLVKLVPDDLDKSIPDDYLDKSIPTGHTSNESTSNESISNVNKLFSNGFKNKLNSSGESDESFSNGNLCESNNNNSNSLIETSIEIITETPIGYIKSFLKFPIDESKFQFGTSKDLSSFKFLDEPALQIPSTEIIKQLGSKLPDLVEVIPDDMIRSANNCFDSIFILYEPHPTAIKHDYRRNYRIRNGTNLCKIVDLNGLQLNILYALKQDRISNHLIKVNLYKDHHLSYLVNAIEIVNSRLNKPQIIIILPTYELAEQVSNEAYKMVANLGVKVKYLNRSNECYLTEHILITSMFSFVYNVFKSLSIDLKSIKQLVFDQVDLLVNSDKYLKNLKSIVSQAENAQIIYFSSTFSKSTTKILCHEIEPNSTQLVHKFLDLTNSSVLNDVMNFYVNCPSKQCRFLSLINLLRCLDLKFTNKIVIFTIGTKSALYLYNRLIIKAPCNLYYVTINLNANERMDLIDSFRTSDRAILIINYPLALNLNLGEVQLVINFDLPLKDKNGNTLTMTELREDNFFFSEYYHRLSVLNSKSKRHCSVINLISNKEFKSVVKPCLENHLKIQLLEIKIPFYNSPTNTLNQQKFTIAHPMKRQNCSIKALHQIRKQRIQSMQRSKRIRLRCRNLMRAKCIY